MLKSDLYPETLSRGVIILLKTQRSISCVSHPAAPCSSPLSFAQERLWFLQQLAPENPLYNIPRAVRLKGILQIGSLEKSINEVIRRHEILRTRFSFRDGQAQQLVVPELLIQLEPQDLQALSENQREEALLKQAHREAQTPFDLATGPLIRATLLRLSPMEHVLFLTMHHIISDGWSMGILLQELMTLYQAFSEGANSPLRDLPIQYRDFAAWQRHWLQGEELETQLSYWKQHLSGAPHVLELPSDHPRLAQETSAGGHLSFDLSKSFFSAIKTLCRQEGVTLYMVLLSAFAVLLHRYTGQDDIVVGTPIANRNHMEIEGLIGFFVNTLVPRLDLSGNPGFRELLGRVRQVTLDAYAHQDLPFEKVVAELRPSRDSNRTPLFQVMFNLQGTPFPPITLPDLTVQFIEIANEFAQFDLMLNLQAESDTLHGWVEYKSDVFDPSTILQLVEHFQRILKVAIADPTLPISTLPLLTDSEYYRLLVGWNSNERAYHADDSIHHVFTEQAGQRPDAIALIYQDTQFTYHEINRRANQLAHYLLTSGIRPESPVGVCMERSPDAIIGLLGILKAGGAYVPLDPTHPRERLAFLLSDSGIQIVLTQERFLEQVPQEMGRTVCFERERDLIWRESEENPGVLVTGMHLAYVMYTSGSTGRPKGVLGLHGATLNRFHWMWQNYPFEADEVHCQKTSFSFVDSLWEIFGSMLQGIPCVILSDQVLHDPRLFLHSLHAYQITRVTLVPSLLQTMLDCSADLGIRVPGVRLWITSGEVLTPTLAHQFVDRAPHATLLNLYGSTEVAGDCTWCDASTQQVNRFSCIGRPINNITAYILDEHLQPVPSGVFGQLYIGGQGLSRGYLNHPALTAHKFIPHPFSAEAGARLYATGDLVRFCSDGAIEYVGRLDQQVKIRGYRVEPDEIAAALCQHERVERAVVLYRQDDDRLAAYITLKYADQAPGDQLDELDISALVSRELRHYLQKILPEYMIPASYSILDVFPLTPSGKIDRQRLLAMPKPLSGSAQHIVPPSTPTEHLLTDIWKDVLRLDRIGMHDNFFDLGGTSLSLMTVCASIEVQVGFSVPVVKLLQYPTIGLLATYLADASSEHQTRLEASRLRGAERRAKLQRRAR